MPPRPIQVLRWFQARTHCEVFRRFERATLRFRRIPSTDTGRSEQHRIWEHQDPQETASIIFRCRSTGIPHGIGLVLRRSQSINAVHQTHFDHVASGICLPDHATAIEWSMNRTQREPLHRSTAHRTLLKCPTLAAMPVAIARTNVSNTVLLQRATSNAQANQNTDMVWLRCHFSHPAVPQTGQLCHSASGALHSATLVQ